MQPDNNSTPAGPSSAGGELLGYTPNMAGATRISEEKPEEEEEKEKKPMGYIITVVVLALLALGFGVYMVIDLVSGSPKCPECVACADPNESKVQVVDFHFDSTAVLYQGEVYVDIDGTSTEFNALFGKGTWDTLGAVRKNYQSYSFGNSSVRTNNNDFTGMKLATKNVVGIYDYEAGQDINRDYGLLLIYEDKTVGYISLADMIMGETDVTPLDGVTDIINIISRNEFSGMITYAITSSGNEVKLNQYIPEEEEE